LKTDFEIQYLLLSILRGKPDLMKNENSDIEFT